MSAPANHKLWSIPLFKRMKVCGRFHQSVRHVLALKLEFLYPVRAKNSLLSPQFYTMERKLLLCALFACGCQMVSFFNSYIIIPDRCISTSYQKQVTPLKVWIVCIKFSHQIISYALENVLRVLQNSNASSKDLHKNQKVAFKKRDDLTYWTGLTCSYGTADIKYSKVKEI